MPSGHGLGLGLARPVLILGHIGLGLASSDLGLGLEVAGLVNNTGSSTYPFIFVSKPDFGGGGKAPPFIRHWKPGRRRRKM